MKEKVACGIVVTTCIVSLITLVLGLFQVIPLFIGSGLMALSLGLSDLAWVVLYHEEMSKVEKVASVVFGFFFVVEGVLTFIVQHL